MANISQDRVRLSASEAQTLAEEALRRIGYDAEEARIIADHVVDAALCGYEYSGLPKILNVAEHRQLRQPRRPMRVLREGIEIDGTIYEALSALPEGQLPALT